MGQTGRKRGVSHAIAYAWALLHMSAAPLPSF